ncbi:PaaI family thioesterase [Hahella sp. SMD15-11]|uniref:PaaI family thioesterase n=1 Tax=Thermohahella caldifontis TaxID=3142973 RepID=A0AB39UWC7_9GAMM
MTESKLMTGFESDPRLLGQASRFVGQLNQCRQLGIRVEAAAHRKLVLSLPYSEAIVGDMETGIIHGGAITTLMDTASGTVVLCSLEEPELCPTLDLRVDYMRAARPNEPVYALAECYRVAHDIVFTRCQAWQTEPERIVAHCVATFMRIGRRATPDWFWKIIEGEGEA